MTAPPAVAPDTPPAPAPPEPDRLSEVDAEAFRLELERARKEAPEWMHIDDDGNVSIREPWVQCPLCSGNGVTKMEFKQSPTHMTCPDCQGLGDIATGSLVPGKDHLMCVTCAGAGWMLTEDWERIDAQRKEASGGGT